MAEKTFPVVVKLPLGKFAFFEGRRVYSGDPLKVTDKQFSKDWMTRKQVQAQPVKKVSTSK